jgi:hypothetical protein
MLKGIHFLLSYNCTYECDHCFVYCGPFAGGTFTIDQIKAVLAEAKKMDAVEEIYLEGGEPFLYYPLMLEAARLARADGLNVGIVSNAYFANSEADAELWLKPLVELGIFDLSISEDSFHGEDEAAAAAKRAATVARKLGLPIGTICIDPPEVKSADPHKKGEPVVGGGVLFKGRAADKLTAGLPTKDWKTFTECSHEELRKPERVHVDCYGNVQVCQGISIGNMWKTPLSEIDANYDPESHPIIGPLLKGGPAELARHYNVELADGYVEECHLCYSVRRALLDRFPDHLAPRQVYGVETT